LTGIEVESAGLAAAPGAGITPQARFALHQAGIPAAAGVSRALTPDLVAGAHLILVMTREHRRELVRRFPQAAGKTRMLLSLADAAEADVADPAGGDSEEYIRCLETMLPALRNVVRELVADRS
jgi:protein-tyrosine-phosphatase